MASSIYKVSYAYPIPMDTEKPSTRLGRGRAVFPWTDMKVGGSFFVPGSDPTTQWRVYNAVYHREYRATHTYVTREVDGGFRVWRVK